MIRLNLNDKDLQIIQSALIYKATTIEKYDNKNSRIKYIHDLLDYITAEKLVLEKFINADCIICKSLSFKFNLIIFLNLF